MHYLLVYFIQLSVVHRFKQFRLLGMLIAKYNCQFVTYAGFEILAFPCNQFGGQEPGTNEEIVQFACTRFKAEYPIFDKAKL
jgi:glutathione peroxidase-family protein